MDYSSVGVAAAGSPSRRRRAISRATPPAIMAMPVSTIPPTAVPVTGRPGVLVVVVTGGVEPPPLGDSEVPPDGDSDGDADELGDPDGDGEGDGPGVLPLAWHVWVTLKKAGCGAGDAVPVISAVPDSISQPAGRLIHALDVALALLTIAPPSAGMCTGVSATWSPSVSNWRVSDTKLRLLSVSTKTHTSWSEKGP